MCPLPSPIGDIASQLAVVDFRSTAVDFLELLTILRALHSADAELHECISPCSCS